MPRAARIVLGALLACAISPALAWEPPQDPNPTEILKEARADRAAKRYEDALAKHLWLQRESLKASPAFVGVRSSFALGDWHALGDRYEPAMAALRAERDRAESDVRAGRDTRFAFADAAAINRELDEGAATVALFRLVEQRDPALAAHAYRAAEDALIEAKDFATCGKYLQPERAFRMHAESYESLAKMAALRQPPTELEAQVARRHFAFAAGRLVAVLVLAGRAGEARAIAAETAKTLDTPEMRETLRQALEGTLPEPLITRAAMHELRRAMP